MDTKVEPADGNQMEIPMSRNRITVIGLGAFVCAAMVVPAKAFQPPKIDVGGAIHVVVPKLGQPVPRPGQPGPDPAFTLRKNNNVSQPGPVGVARSIGGSVRSGQQVHFDKVYTQTQKVWAKPVQAPPPPPPPTKDGGTEASSEIGWGF
jgi:hypothetical protein